MDSADLPNKPEASALGSISLHGANSALESDNSKPSRVVVWCVKRAKFLKPCTDEFSTLPECACIPMGHYLNDGLMGRIPR